MNFRFHIVSLTAVFFALAIGLVVGTAALNGPVADSLAGQVDGLGEQNEQLRDQVSQLRSELETQERIAAQLAPAALAGRLAGDRVVVVAAPSGVQYADEVIEMLGLAGASVTGSVELTPDFVDPNRSDALRDLAVAALPPSLKDGLPADGGGVANAAALLGGVLLSRTPGITESDQRSVLSAYTSRGFLVERKPVTGGAGSMILVTGPAAGDAQRNAALLATVAAFARTGQVVVGGIAATGAGNLITSVRSDPGLAVKISTVDNVATPTGQLVLAWATAEQLAGRPGHYGVGTGAKLFPTTTS